MSGDYAAQIAAARAAVRTARRIVALTGAGVSAESGIATFRGGAEGGMEALWKSFDPRTLATPEAFARNPKMVTEWYDWRRQRCREAVPNAAHAALATLERALAIRGGSFTLLTQNVDRLHQRAGSRNVVELHGNIVQWRCAATGRLVDIPEGPLASTPFPSPHQPGAFVRPGVVWFGEILPEDALRAAHEAVHELGDGDVFLTIGTAAVVYPAAGFIDLAAARGARVIEVNPDATPYSSRVDWRIRGKAGHVLPLIVGA